MKIDIGCGTVKDGESSPEGYLRQDVDTSIENLDIVCNISDLDKHVKPESCDVIRASHVMEHFPTKEIPTLFKMIHGLLKKGGIFNIIVPNIKYHSALILNDRDELGIEYAFGGQLDEWDFHKTAFTPKLLMTKLVEAGFTIKSISPDSSIGCEAIK